MIDEESRRKPGFAEGEWIKLGDEQSWCFRRPTLRLTGVARDDGSLDYEMRAVYVGVEDAEYERHFEVALSSEGMPFIVAMLNLAARLLMMNYDLTPGECGSLLPRIPGDDANSAMWEAIKGVAFGDPPKTYGQWLRCVVIRAAGAVDLPLADAVAVADMEVMTGRAPHYAAWVEDAIARRADARSRAMLEHLV